MKTTFSLIMHYLYTNILHDENCIRLNVLFVFVFNSVVDYCPGRAENPECIAPEGADEGVSQWGGAASEDWRGEEPTATHKIPARQHKAWAEGVF